MQDNSYVLARFYTLHPSQACWHFNSRTSNVADMQIFFALGYNKSGTTYLQRLLDEHPRANCPPEHDLKSVARYLQAFLRKYRTTIQTIDDRTARQGLRYNENHVFQHAMRGIVTGFITDHAKPGTTHFGLNDNFMWRNLPFYGAIFPEARFVGIVRDPRAVAVSLYNHRLRTEPRFKNSGITLSMTAEGVGRTWAECMAKYEEFATKPEFESRFHVVRYEDLAGTERDKALLGIYTFLGLDANDEIVERALASNDFADQRAKSVKGSEFLYSGPGEKWREELGDDDIASVEASAGRFLAAYRYTSFGRTMKEPRPTGGA